MKHLQSVLGMREEKLTHYFGGGNLLTGRKEFWNSRTSRPGMGMVLNPVENNFGTMLTARIDESLCSL